MRLDAERVSRIAGERMRLRQQWQVQVPVRLPQVLDVADFAFVAIVDGAGAPRASRPTRQRIAIPLRRITELAIGEIEEAVLASEYAFRGGGQVLGRKGDERRQETKVACGRITRRRFVRDELLRQDAQAACQPVRHLGARHHFETLQVPCGLLHASPRKQRLHSMTAKCIRGAIVVVRIAPDQHLPEHVIFHEPGK